MWRSDVLGGGDFRLLMGRLRTRGYLTGVLIFRESYSFGAVLGGPLLS